MEAMMHSSQFCALCLFPLLCGVAVVNASIIGVTGFTQIPGAAFSAPPTNFPPSSPTIEGVTLTLTPPSLNEAFGFQSTLFRADVPGTGNGVGSDPTGTGNL